MSQPTRRDMLAGLASAGVLGLAGSARGQILGPIVNGGISIPRNGLIACYEQANTPGAQGAVLSSVFDSSGNAFTATQSVTAQKPTINSRTVSGGRAIYFPGGNGLTTDLLMPAGVTVSTQSCSVVLITEVTYSNSSSYLINFGANNLYLNNNSGKLTAGPGVGASGLFQPWGPQVVGFSSSSTGFKYLLVNTMAAATGTITAASPAGGTINCFGTNQFNAAGNVYAVLIYNRAINQADLNRIHAYARAKYRVRPVSPFMLLATCGDSLTAGYVAGGYNGLGCLQQWLINNPTYTAYNFGVTGSKTSALINPDAVFSSIPAKKICWIWSGTNDLAAGNSFVAGALTNIANFVTARRATGWKCVTATMLPRTGGVSANTDPFETDRQTFNSAIRANAGGIYGDAIADVGSDAVIGQAGQSSNTTYYWNDSIHLTQAGCTLALNNYFAPAIASL